MTRIALEDELVRRPDDLADVVVDRHVRTLLGEVVEGVGIDLADGDRALGTDERVDRLGGGAADVEPALEPDEHDRTFERADVAGVELEDVGGLHQVALLSPVPRRRGRCSG